MFGRGRSVDLAREDVLDHADITGTPRQKLGRADLLNVTRKTCP